MNTIKSFSLSALCLGFLFFSCTTEEEPFVPNPAYKGGVVDAEVGGPTQPNQVYIDLSQNKNTVSVRQDWDLGFYAGTDNTVILNSANEMLAYPINKTDLNSVNATDTIGLGAQLSLDAIFGALFAPVAPPWLSESPTWIDDPSRDLSNTAIGEINTDALQNFVFIINRGNTPDGISKGWKKIRILIAGDGYEIRYADIADTDFNSSVIQKSTAYNFSFFSFELGELLVEPKTKQWDLAFTTWTELTSFGSSPVPYFFMDYVIINQVGVQVAEVVNDQTQSILEDFNNFSKEDALGLTFSNKVNTIAGSWRTVASPTPGSVTGVKSDRFYVIEDAGGNRYKLIFTKMLNDQGERGYPQILFDLL